MNIACIQARLKKKSGLLNAFKTTYSMSESVLQFHCCAHDAKRAFNLQVNTLIVNGLLQCKPGSQISNKRPEVSSSLWLQTGTDFEGLYTK